VCCKVSNLEQEPQTSDPHCLQWCFRWKKVKVAPQSGHADSAEFGCQLLRTTFSLLRTTVSLVAQLGDPLCSAAAASTAAAAAAAASSAAAASAASIPVESIPTGLVPSLPKPNACKRSSSTEVAVKNSTNDTTPSPSASISSTLFATVDAAIDGGSTFVLCCVAR
jgi:hypothetical protein